jgi:hypothetical protein
MALSNNRINTTIAAADATAIRNALTAIETAFANYSRPLTVDERKSLPKIQSNNKTFTEDAITAAQNNPNFLPGYFNVNDLAVDLSLYMQLEEFVQKLRSILEMFEDLQMLSGSEAYTGALAFYRLMEAAKKAGQPGADAVYNNLKTRFAGQGGGGQEEPAAATP